MHAQRSFIPGSVFYLVVGLYMKSGRHKPTLLAEIARAMQTEIKAHYTSSKCSSRIQLSPRKKQQDGSLPYEGGNNSKNYTYENISICGWAMTKFLKLSSSIYTSSIAGTLSTRSTAQACYYTHRLSYVLA